jgi:hypothetical protein
MSRPASEHEEEANLGAQYNELNLLDDFVLLPDNAPRNAERKDVDCASLILDRPRSERFSATASKEVIPPAPTRAFQVQHLCSDEECASIIELALPLMRSTSRHFAQRHRVSRRALLLCPAAAEELFRRLVPHVRIDDYAGHIPLCFGQGGAWVPYRLNHCLKVVEYAESTSHFAAHRDGPWIPRQDEASMFTVLLYLNSVPATEETPNFYRSRKMPGHTVLLGSRSDEPIGSRQLSFDSSSDVRSIAPVTGTALVFNHDCWHRGNPPSGTKFILRTELIFRRTHAAYVDRFLYSQSEVYRTTRELYKMSLEAMEQGDKERFFVSYQDVIAQQRAAMEATLAEIGPQRSALVSRVGPNVASLILELAGLGAVIPFMLVNRATYYAVVQLPLWFSLTCSQFPEAATGAPSRWLMRSVAPSPTCSSSSSAFPFVPLDWMTIYSQLRETRREFDAAVLDLSCAAHPLLYLNSKRFRKDAAMSAHWRGIDNLPFVPDPEEPHSCIAAVPAFYEDWHFAYPLHMNQPPGERFELHMSIGDTHSRKPCIDPRNIVVDWSILAVSIEVVTDPTRVPFVLVGCPHWFASDAHQIDLEQMSGVVRGSGSSQNEKVRQSKGDGDDAQLASRQLVERLFLEQTRAPAVVTMHPAVVACAAASTSTGTAPESEEEMMNIARSACLSTPACERIAGDESRNTLVVFVSRNRIYRCPVDQQTMLPGHMVASSHLDNAEDVDSQVQEAVQEFATAIVVLCDTTSLELSCLGECCRQEPLQHERQASLTVLTHADLCRAAGRLSRSPLFRQLCTFRW